MTAMAKLAGRFGRFRIGRKEAHVIRPAGPRPQRRDCQGQLLARLRVMAGPDATIDQTSMRPWCSATFVGARHRLLLVLAGPDADQRAAILAQMLPEADFRLNGHIVADVVVEVIPMNGEKGTTLSLEILTIEDW